MVEVAKEHKVLQEEQVELVDKEHKVHKEVKDSKELLDPQEEPAQQEDQVQQEDQDLKDLKVLKVIRELRGQQDLLQKHVHSMCIISVVVVLQLVISQLGIVLGKILQIMVFSTVNSSVKLPV